MFDSSAGIIQALGFFIFLIIAVGIGITVLYILTLRKALTQCAPQNRTTSPDSAWLLLIPIFHLIWAFILYQHISESLEREFRQRNLPIEAQPAKNLGLTLAILQVCCIIPIVNFIAGIGVLVCFIMYWVKISGYAEQLAAAPAVYYPQPPQTQWGSQPPAPTQQQWNSQPPLAAAAGATAPHQNAPAMPQARHCTGCGAFVQPTERFCGTCGKPVV